MNKTLRHQIQHLARLSPSTEICGFAVLPPSQIPTLFPCPNVAANPAEHYEISADDHLAASRAGHILWAYHSHPVAGGFSEADLEYAEENTLPQWVFDIPSNQFHHHLPSSHHPAPLEGRPFVWGESDCYSIIIDGAWMKWKHRFTDYPRDETDSGPTLGALVLQQIEAEGLVKLSPLIPLQKDDILVFRTNGSPQHFAWFMGNSRVMHHPLGGLSRIDSYSLAWQRRLHCILRLKHKPQ